jgi:hypothetical protein
MVEATIQEVEFFNGDRRERRSDQTRWLDRGASCLPLRIGLRNVSHLGLRLRLYSATLQSVPTPHRQSSLDTLKKLDKLTDELETAKHASQVTTKEVQHARRTTQRVKRDVRVQLLAERNGRKGRNIKGGKSEAAVELGQKGGAARAKMLTAKQRSALATKAAKVRWNSAR